MKLIQERFMEKISPEPNSGCWLWTAGGCMKNGLFYGAFGMNQKTVGAHVASYLLFVGPISAGLVIDHLCRNTYCVNPRHLEQVSGRVNILRGIGAAAQNVRKAHCINGHEFSDSNTAVDFYKKGFHRRCRECTKANWRRQDIRRAKGRK